MKKGLWFFAGGYLIVNSPLKNPSITAILSCFFVVEYGYCVAGDAQSAPNIDSASRKDLGANSAAQVLVEQLNSTKAEVRENAATALQAMGKKAANALATYIRNNLSEHNVGGIKAITVLGKIGNEIADDDDVRNALLSAASLPLQTDSPELQLAAIDALKEINKYRGGILIIEDDNAPDTFDPDAAILASDSLAQIAEDVFEKSKVGGAPTPKPPWDNVFYSKLKILRESQAKLVKAAAQVSAVASRSKPKEFTFSKLTDEKTLASSLRKIVVGYLDATKTTFSSKPVDQADDKSRWQLKAEAAYDLLTETRELRYQLYQLHKAIGTFKKDQDNLAALVAQLAGIAAISKSELIKTATAIMLNAIFSKLPEKQAATDSIVMTFELKKGVAKKETDNKDAETKDGTKKNAAKEEKSKSN
jgi:hypothetical protein